MAKKLTKRMEINKKKTIERNTVLRGIGINNFKAFGEYTFVPIESLSMFIGPNGSGKSSCWQILALLNKCLKLESRKDDQGPFGSTRKTTFSLRDYDDLGLSPGKLLHNPGRPLVIDLVCCIKYNSQLYLSEELITFRFLLEPIEKDQLFHLKEVSLLDAHEKLLMRFVENYEFEGTDLDIFSHFVNERTEESSNNLGQYLLDVCFSLHNYDLKSSKHDINPDLLIQNESFYKWDNHECSLDFGIPTRWDKNYAFITDKETKGSRIFLMDNFNKWESLIDSGVRTNEDLINHCNSFKQGNPLLYQALNSTYTLIEDTFNDLIKNEIEKIFVLDKRKVGFSERLLSNTSETGELLKDFAKQVRSYVDIADSGYEEDISNTLNDLLSSKLSLPAESAPILHEHIDYNSIYKRLGFKKVPEIIEDYSNKTICIEYGDENLRNAGSGFWSLTFIVMALIKAKNEKRIIIIEEPEINLHPNLQVELMDLLIDFACKYNMTIIVETHSEYMLRRLQLRVHEGESPFIGSDVIDEVRRMYGFNNFRSVKIRSNKVIVNSFEESNTSAGMYQCRSIKIDTNGNMAGELPHTFSSIASNDAMLLNIWANKAFKN